MRTDTARPLLRLEGRIRRLVSVEIDGNRWFQRTHGNTYHVARVRLLTECGGRHEHHGRTSDVTYGYGSQYEQTARAVLLEMEPRAFARLAERGNHGTDRHALWQFFREMCGVEYQSSVDDVRRKRDL